MDFHDEINVANCRLCLCKCETARNLLEDTDFADKIMEIFPKVVISPGNGLSTLICDYCHGTVKQFIGFYENVNANQDELMKMLPEVTNEEVFAEPIVNFEYKMQPSDLKTDENDDDSTVIESQEPDDILPEPDLKPQIPKIQNITKIDYTKDDLESLNFFELVKLPLSFGKFIRCQLCPKSDRYKNLTHLKPHIIKQHLGHLRFTEKPKEVKKYTENLDLYCDVCEKVLPPPKTIAYRDHKFLHYDIKPYKCEICGYDTSSKNLIRIHIIKKHLEPIKKWKCNNCEMDFTSKALKNNHIIEKHSENLIPCEKCGLKLLDKKKLRAHLEQEHSENSLKIDCSRCVGGIKFPDERVLALHQQQHVREDKVKKNIYCNLCERGFNYENSYKSHLKLHAENRLKACNICGKTIFYEAGRRISKHMMNHTKKQPEILKCDKCGEEFTRKVALSKHLRKVHDRREKSCYKCGKLIEQYLMKRHLNFCNYGDLKCFHCPMVFSKPSERDKHTKQTHIGYNCRRCNIRFENSSQLEFHRRYNENHKNYKNLLNKRRNDQ